MEQEILIRPARLDDMALLADMLHALAMRFIVPGMPPEAAATFLRENDGAALLAYRERGHATSLAEIDGVVAGFISIRPPSHLFHLFVGEARQRRGVARALWDSVRANADTFTVNASPYAVPAYLALGFCCAGPPACRNGVSYQPMRWQREG
jgi:GNAT superfamily N-acetyltransferase